MASGHVNRIYRPNTWQHRPSLRREDFSCQPGMSAIRSLSGVNRTWRRETNSVVNDPRLAFIQRHSSSIAPPFPIPSDASQLAAAKSTDTRL